MAQLATTGSCVWDSDWYFPTLIIWYTLDSLYVYINMTEKIDTTTFHVTNTDVQLMAQLFLNIYTQYLGVCNFVKQSR